MFMYILVAVLSFALIYDVFIMKSGKGWRVVNPGKKGGSFSLYFMDKHIANVRGKTKAMVLLSAIQGKNMTKDLDMTPVAVVKPMVKKAVVKAVSKPVVKKVAAKKVVAKTTKKVAAKKVTKATKK